MKVTLQNLGKKESYGAEIATKSAPRVIYPEIWLDDKNLSGIEKLSAGQKVKLMFDAEVMLVEVRDEKKPDGMKKNWSARLSLRKGGIIPKTAPKNTLQAFVEAAKEEEDDNE